MTTLLEDESGIETSFPREGIEFILPSVTYRIATGTRDRVIAGATFRASAAGRSEVILSVANDRSGALVVEIPVAHALAQRYLQGGVPPRQILVNVHRAQSSTSEVIYRGAVTSMAVDGQVARFLVPSHMGLALSRRLPTISAGRSCPHILYDANCRVDRALHKVMTTVAAINGRTVTLADDGGKPDRWSRWGELVHVASSEPRTVADHVGLVITMQLPIPGMNVGDTVELYAGCSHDVAGCAGFANVVNFGGYPYLPTRNLFAKNGYGTVTSI